MRTTEQECLAALREAAERFGKSPTKAEYEDPGLTPASATISRVVGGWNEAKEEADLGTILCANCHRREHYGSSPDDADENLRTWLYERTSTAGCSRCEETDPRCPVCHHDGNRKRATVAKMVSDGWSRREIEAELERCVVLCANCHRLEHFEPPGNDEASAERLR